MRPFRKIPYSNETGITLKKWLKSRAHIALDYDLPEPEALFIGLKATVAANDWPLARPAKYSVSIQERPDCRVVNAHSLRHHFGTDLAKRGFNNSLISEALGHAQLSSSFQYTQVNNEDLEFALRKRLN